MKKQRPAYNLRVSDCIIPVKGLINYIQRVNNMSDKEPIMDGVWTDVVRYYSLAISQAVVISSSILLIKEGIDALIK